MFNKMVTLLTSPHGRQVPDDAVAVTYHTHKRLPTLWHFPGGVEFLQYLVSGQVSSW